MDSTFDSFDNIPKSSICLLGICEVECRLMAKAIITISDGPDGSTDMKFEFRPALTRGAKLSKAQALGYQIAEALGGEAIEKVAPAMEIDTTG